MLTTKSNSQLTCFKKVRLRRLARCDGSWQVKVVKRCRKCFWLTMSACFDKMPPMLRICIVVLILILQRIEEGCAAKTSETPLSPLFCFDLSHDGIDSGG